MVDIRKRKRFFTAFVVDYSYEFSVCAIGHFHGKFIGTVNSSAERHGFSVVKSYFYRLKLSVIIKAYFIA